MSSSNAAFREEKEREDKRTADGKAPALEPHAGRPPPLAALQRQASLMAEAYALAQNLEHMTYEQRRYGPHFTSFQLSMKAASRRFGTCPELERVQLMTEAISGLLIAQAMFAEIRQSEAMRDFKDALFTRRSEATAMCVFKDTLFFEPRTVAALRDLSNEVHTFISGLRAGGKAEPQTARPKGKDPPVEEAAEVPPSALAQAQAPLLASSLATAEPSHGLSDEELARQLQDEENALVDRSYRRDVRQWDAGSRYWWRAPDTQGGPPGYRPSQTVDNNILADLAYTYGDDRRREAQIIQNYYGAPVSGSAGRPAEASSGSKNEERYEIKGGTGAPPPSGSSSSSSSGSRAQSDPDKVSFHAFEQMVRGDAVYNPRAFEQMVRGDAVYNPGADEPPSAGGKGSGAEEA